MCVKRGFDLRLYRAAAHELSHRVESRRRVPLEDARWRACPLEDARWRACPLEDARWRACPLEDVRWRACPLEDVCSGAEMTAQGAAGEAASALCRQPVTAPPAAQEEPLHVQMVSSMRIGRNVNYRILDIDWCTSDKVVLASDDGCIRVLEMAMKSASYRMDEQDLTDPVWCPYLLVPRAALTLKAFLLLQPWSGTFTMDITQVDYQEKGEIKGLIQEQLNSLSNDMKSALQDPELSLLQRCLLVSR
ncbi:WD repeat-containing protein 11 [Liparis tanakae]|uniref:WD repeat-containing protein 11 n=1 Tax=Liparis tanakae TaxID=230148 RepID=A0A4Z2E6T0_9TELE|nr:WD repeat-containing protein 11 [Liparis tanakae]